MNRIKLQKLQNQLMTIHDDTEVVGRGPTAVPEAVAFGIPGDSFKDGSCKYTVVEKKTLQMKVNLCFQDMPSSLETESVKGLMENVELPISSPDKSKSDRSDTVPEGYIATQASTERYGDLDTESKDQTSNEITEERKLKAEDIGGNVQMNSNNGGINSNSADKNDPNACDSDDDYAEVGDESDDYLEPTFEKHPTGETIPERRPLPPLPAASVFDGGVTETQPSNPEIFEHRTPSQFEEGYKTGLRDDSEASTHDLTLTTPAKLDQESLNEISVSKQQQQKTLSNLSCSESGAIVPISQAGTRMMSGPNGYLEQYTMDHPLQVAYFALVNFGLVLLIIIHYQNELSPDTFTKFCRVIGRIASCFKDCVQPPYNEP